MIARLAVPAAFALRDFRIQRGSRVGFVLGIGAAVANVIVFFFLSEALGVVSGSGIRAYGSDYFGFAIVGIAFTQIVAVGVGSMGGAVREGQVTGTLELMLIGPTPPIVALLSSGLSPTSWRLPRSRSTWLLARSSGWTCHARTSLRRSWRSHSDRGMQRTRARRRGGRAPHQAG